MRITCRMTCIVSLVAGCTTVSIKPGNDTPLPPAEVSLPVPPAAAFDRALAALLAEGYTVDSGNKESGLIKAAGIMGDFVKVGGSEPGTGRAEYFIRMTIVPAQTGSRVSLGATSRTHLTIDERGTSSSSETPIHECVRLPVVHGDLMYRICRQDAAMVRSRLDRLAQRLSSVSPPP